jgi:putative alpha-1,2-mannosidase
MKGGRLDIKMSDVPNKQRGINSKAFPYSMSSDILNGQKQSY